MALRRCLLACALVACGCGPASTGEDGGRDLAMLDRGGGGLDLSAVDRPVDDGGGEDGGRLPDLGIADGAAGELGLEDLGSEGDLPPPDLGGAADLAVAVDQLRPFDLAAAADLAASPPDLAAPRDLTLPRDLAAPRDLATPSDLARPCGSLGLPCCAAFQCGLGTVCSAGTCVQAVRPFACPPNAAPAVFVGEQPPPSPMMPWSEHLATVTFANCSAGGWKAVPAGAPVGHKLGSQAPQDNDTWTGSSRIALPADVAPGRQVTVAIAVRAPALLGTYGWSWGIVDEQVAWLKQSSPPRTLTVAAPARPVTLCPGLTGDAGGLQPAAVAIQQCIDQAPAGGVVELPPGHYRIDRELRIDKPLTLRTVGLSGSMVGCLDLAGPPCAVLFADPALQAPRGFLRLGATDKVLLDHLVLDGNRGARLASAAAQQCRMGNNGAGFNAAAAGCTGCSILRSASVRALCGTGFEWVGDDLTVAGSTFRDNGDHGANNLWADGLTVLRSNGASITGSRFLDNSDVALILGGATGATVRNNTIRQLQQAAFAGLMLDNFNGGTPGDFTGATVRENTVDCTDLLCDFGIELGPHPWYLSKNIEGGTVTRNVVGGAKINLNVEGAGTQAKPIVVSANTVGAAPVSAPFSCGVRPCASFNVSPDSVVDFGGGPQATGSHTHHLCP